jgi:hypothetical protein
MVKRTSTSFRGGCFQCHGSDVHWTAKNTAGVVAKHAEATGHEVWLEVLISVTYNPEP